MAKDIQDRIGQIVGSDSARALAGTAVTEALKALGGQRSSSNGAGSQGGRKAVSQKGLSGMRGLAAGAGAAAVAPMAAKGIGKLIKGNGAEALAGGPKKLAEEATSKLGDTVEGKLKDKVQEAGGPGGILKDTVKNALPFGGGGGGGGGKNDAEGVGKGRRMPIQQSFDIGLPIETVYNQWTQFEEWPKFMHRVTRASQEDPCKVNFAVKIWGKTKEFTAEIETQRPDDRIKWKTTQGMNLTGVVAFRELGPNLTRVLVSFDVAPGGLVEKYARGARYVKRAARADLHRFVAFIEMLEHETGAWRGVIEDGELVEDHDPSYDEEREYGSADELVHGRGSEEDDEDSDEDEDEDSDGDEDEDSDGDEDEETSGRNGGEPRQRSKRGASSSRQRGSASRAQSRSGGSSSRSAARSSSSGRSSSGRSSSSRSKSQPRSTTSSRSSSGSGSRGRSANGSSSKRSSSGSSRSSGKSNGSSASGRSSSGRASGRSSSSGRSSGSSSGGASKRSSGSSSGRARSGGASRSSRSSADHQGRQRTRSSRRS